ncbi:sugar transferase [Halorubraceae archaeon YAN]|nr:sugar transferase [Halorubraceae archaeon YAN]
MIHGWWYRSVSLIGAVLITAVGVVIANHPFAQVLTTTYVPFLWRIDPVTLSGDAFQIAAWTSVILVVGALVPLFKPRPWRVLDVITYTQKRVIVAGLALATLGYFNWSYRLPRTTLAILIAVLLILLPLWFVLIRTKTPNDDDRTIIVGDDLAQIEEIAASSSGVIVGYLSPPITYTDEQLSDGETATRPIVADGSGGAVNGMGLPRLGGLSKIETVLLEHDIDTVCLAYRTADRGEFFGTLDLCHKHGVAAKVHREYADDVLTSAEDVSTLARVDVEPWDPQDYVFKRLFDIAFAGFGLLVLAPLVVAISIAIKLDSPGPVFYTQDRTAAFGETFSVYKFRSMVTDAEAQTGAKISEEDAGGVDPRVTRVGYILRKSHLDEIPQLWSILNGDMSVVGPRPERPEIDSDIQMGGVDWSKRWFIKPGLTGVAQINGATGHNPDAKLRYDIQYIRHQSFSYDLMIVIRQLWMAFTDGIAVLRGRDPEAEQSNN